MIKDFYSCLMMVVLVAGCAGRPDQSTVRPAREVISRSIGSAYQNKFVLAIDTTLVNAFSAEVKNNRLFVKASTQGNLCRGVYHYLTNACNSIVSWSGNRINIPDKLPAFNASVKSHFKYHYYFNVVTHGYTTAYWDWPRWEKELDWMALHGINMPLLPGAHEAILRRVFAKMGLSEQAIAGYFTGPAHFPWNKMGEMTGWDGPVPESYFGKQIELTHKVLNRIRELGMHPIVPAFAGFVPEGIKTLFPDEKIRELSWGGFDKKYQSHILEPGSPLFIRIGELYIREYEKEFGKQEFYLADSFNEMDVPLSADPAEALNELASYGESVYRSIQKANNEAIWVMQGWTFPYQMKDGKLFWTPERLHALVSKVPDDKLMILDLANEYNRLWWNSEPSWKMYPGFFGKQWIYSFIPNMGGKTAMNGRLDLYASMPFEAINFPGKGNLTGFGFAPEGIENNEIIYELLSDVGWANEAIPLENWIKRYCTNRYGQYPDSLKKAFEYFNASCFGSFTDHPRNTYQFRPDSRTRGSVNRSEELDRGVKLFLSCKDSFAGNSPGNRLYASDAVEYACQYIGNKADQYLAAFQGGGEKDSLLLSKALDLLIDIDRLLASHPTWRLENWANYARAWGDTEEEKAYYESNARRLITTWGGWVNEYAAKTWSGLIRDYYVPRWRLYYQAKAQAKPFNLPDWEETWIRSSGISTVEPYGNPVEAACDLVNRN